MLSLFWLSRQWETHQACLISLIQVLSFRKRDKRIGWVSDSPLCWFCPSALQMHIKMDRVFGYYRLRSKGETVFSTWDQHVATLAAFRAESNIWILACVLTTRRVEWTIFISHHGEHDKDFCGWSVTATTCWFASSPLSLIVHCCFVLLNALSVLHFAVQQLKDILISGI